MGCRKLKYYQNVELDKNSFKNCLRSEKSKNKGRSDYVYGFNGMEKDNAVKGQGNSYTTRFRQYDPRVGRWLSIDPKGTAFESPYVGFSDNPIMYSDPMGDTIRIRYINKKGNTQYYTYDTKIKVPDNNFVKNTVKALNYLKNNGFAKKIINKISSSKSKTLRIAKTQHGASDFDFNPVLQNKETGKILKKGDKVSLNSIAINKGVIEFNPFSSIKFGGDKTISPATALFHEIGHSFVAFFATPTFVTGNKKIAGSAYDNENERIAIKMFENIVAKYFGEGIRKSHSGIPIKTKSPISNTESLILESQYSSKHQAEIFDKNDIDNQ